MDKFKEENKLGNEDLVVESEYNEIKLNEIKLNKIKLNEKEENKKENENQTENKIKKEKEKEKTLLQCLYDFFEELMSIVFDALYQAQYLITKNRKTIFWAFVSVLALSNFDVLSLGQIMEDNGITNGKKSNFSNNQKGGLDFTDAIKAKAKERDARVAAGNSDDSTGASKAKISDAKTLSKEERERKENEESEQRFKKRMEELKKKKETRKVIQSNIDSNKNSFSPPPMAPPPPLSYDPTKINKNDNSDKEKKEEKKKEEKGEKGEKKKSNIGDKFKKMDKKFGEGIEDLKENLKEVKKKKKENLASRKAEKEKKKAKDKELKDKYMSGSLFERAKGYILKGLSTVSIVLVLYGVVLFPVIVCAVFLYMVLKVCFTNLMKL